MTGTRNFMTEAPNHNLLADVLRRVRLSDAVFLRGEFSAPWGFTSTDAAALAQVLVPGARRLVLLHLAVEGRFHIRLATGEQADVEAGDAIVLPYCDVHTMTSPGHARARAITELLPPLPWRELPVVARDAGGGEPTRILCGYLDCDDLLFNPLLGALPRLIHLRGARSAAAEWRRASLRYVAEETRGAGGCFELLARIPELVLVDCLRQYAEELPPGRKSWLAALHDPLLGRALAELHAQPDARWTVDDLARRVAVSRSVRAERFSAVLGVSPMRYLAQWRLQLAAELLRTTRLGMAALAGRVGYESEAAFSRAFKRHLGVSPAHWRERNG